MADREQPARGASWRTWMVQRRIELTLFVLCLLAGVYFKHPMEYDNTRVRMFTSASLAEHGTWHIDQYAHLTIDISSSGGHTYSNKGIGQTLLAAPLHWLLYRTPLGREGVLNLPTVVLLEFFTAALPHALAALLVYLLALRWSGSPRQGLFTGLAYGIGTIAWQHATMFSGHVLTAALGIGSFYILHRVATKPEGRPAWLRAGLLAWGAGILAGWATLTDYPAALLAVILTVYFASRRPRWQLFGAFVVGGAVMAGLLMWFNAKHFGSPFALSYGSLALESFREGTSRGVMGITMPNPLILLRLLFLPDRGLLAISPVLILAVPGAVAMWRRRELRREWWMVMATAVVFLLWNAGYFGWHSGWAYGSRYQVVILPFVCLLLAPLPRVRVMGWLLLAVSFVQNLLAIAIMPYPPDDIANPLVEVIVPLAGFGYRALNGGDLVGLRGWWGVAPLLVLLLALFVFLWRWTAPAEEDGDARLALAWRLVAVSWLVMVLAMLVFVRTPDRAVPYHVRARLLRDLGHGTGSMRLIELALEEQRRGISLRED